MHRTFRESGTRATRGQRLPPDHAGHRARRRLARQLGHLRARARLRLRRVGRSAPAPARPRGARRRTTSGSSASSSSAHPARGAGRAQPPLQARLRRPRHLQRAHPAQRPGLQGQRPSASPAAATAPRSRPTSATCPPRSAPARGSSPACAPSDRPQRAPRRRACAGASSSPSPGERGPPSRSPPRRWCSPPAAWRRRVILQRASSRNASGWVGKDLQLHPGPRHHGHLRRAHRSVEGRDPGLPLAPLPRGGHQARGALVAARRCSPRASPGIGHDYQRHLLQYDRMAPFDVIIAADRSRGDRARAARPGWDPDITFHFDDDDVALIQRGLGILSDICWASGAESASCRASTACRSSSRARREAEILRTRRLDGERRHHRRPTTRSAPRGMSQRPEDGVVDEEGRCHDVDNLYVADTGHLRREPGGEPDAHVHGARRQDRAGDRRALVNAPDARARERPAPPRRSIPGSPDCSSGGRSIMVRARVRDVGTCAEGAAHGRALSAGEGDR